MRKIFVAAGFSALIFLLLVLGIIGLIIYGIVKVIILFPVILLIIGLLVVLSYIRRKLHEKKTAKPAKKDTIDARYRIK